MFSPETVLKPGKDFQMLTKAFPEGAFGQINLINLPQHNNLKVIMKRPITSPELTEEFQAASTQQLLNEATFLKQLSHPNIVGFVHVQGTNVDMQLFMEYGSKGDLMDYAAEHSKEPGYPDTIISFAQHGLSALTYLTNKNIIHRDIKPENWFISNKGSMKLGDFGFAMNKTKQEYRFVGTTIYLAPEVFITGTENGKVSEGNKKIIPYSAQSDLYAFGAVLAYTIAINGQFYCNLGIAQTPENDEQIMRLLIAAKGTQLNPQDIIQNVTPSLLKIINQAMSFDPTKRTTAAYLLLSLKESGKHRAESPLHSDHLQRRKSADSEVALAFANSIPSTPMSTPAPSPTAGF